MLTRYLTLALKNLKRRMVRTLLTVAGVGLDLRLKARLGRLGLAVLDIHGSQRQHRRPIAGITRECLAECFTCGRTVRPIRSRPNLAVGRIVAR